MYIRPDNAIDNYLETIESAGYKIERSNNKMTISLDDGDPVYIDELNLLEVEATLRNFIRGLPLESEDK